MNIHEEVNIYDELFLFFSYNNKKGKNLLIYIQFFYCEENPK